MSLTLRRLTALEESKLLQELKDLESRIFRSNSLLASPAEINEMIIQESLFLKQKYGTPRKSVLLPDVETALDDKDLIPNHK
jgi:DNA gyrase subunit A